MLAAVAALAATNPATALGRQARQSAPARPSADANQSHGAKSSDTTASLVAGRRIFVRNCGACHGLDARGGERAPNILARPEVQRMSAAAISQAIAKGVPAKGMPSFDSSLDASSIRDVALYLRSLERNNVQSVALPGNPGAGKTLFFGKAGCAECHMVNGTGGFLGADLSAYAAVHGVDEIRQPITNPIAFVGRTPRTVAVVTRSGERLTGIARNEDNFSLQLQTPDGAFHLLTKSELVRIDYPQQSLMPADYGQRLNASELNDLISFLMRAAVDPQRSSPAPNNPDDD